MSIAPKSCGSLALSNDSTLKFLDRRTRLDDSSTSISAMKKLRAKKLFRLDSYFYAERGYEIPTRRVLFSWRAIW